MGRVRTAREKERDHERYVINKEIFIARRRAWEKRNAARCVRRVKKYKASHPWKVDEWARSYRLKHRRAKIDRQEYLPFDEAATTDGEGCSAQGAQCYVADSEENKRGYGGLDSNEAGP